MRKFILILVIAFFAGAGISGKDRKKALENPLDCAVYLATIKKDQDTDLYAALFDVGRYDDLLELIGATDRDPVELYVGYAAHFLKKNNTVEANRFLDSAIASLRRSEDYWSEHPSRGLALYLAIVGRDAEALEIVEHQEDDEERAEVLMRMAEGYIKAGNDSKAVQVLSRVGDLDETSSTPDKMIGVLHLYSRMYRLPEPGKPVETPGLNANSGRKAELLELLAAYEKTNLVNSDYARASLFVAIVPLYIRLGELDRAEQIWQQYRDPSDPYDLMYYTQALIDAGYPERAEPYLMRLRSDKTFLERLGGLRLVELYLSRGDVETARSVALSIAGDENDNFAQHSALIRVAERFRIEGDREAALGLVDLSYRKAREVGEEHRTQDSIGASPRTRKIIYLREVRELYFKLGLFEKGLNVARWIKTGDDAKEFRARGLIEYAAEKSKTMSAKQLAQLIKDAENSCDKDDYCRNGIKVRAAEIFAKEGDKGRALEKLNDVLDNPKEHSYFRELGLEAARIFEKYKLTADKRMKKLLKEMIEDAD